MNLPTFARKWRDGQTMPSKSSVVTEEPQVLPTLTRKLWSHWMRSASAGSYDLGGDKGEKRACILTRKPWSCWTRSPSAGSYYLGGDEGEKRACILNRKLWSHWMRSASSESYDLGGNQGEKRARILTRKITLNKVSICMELQLGRG